MSVDDIVMWDDKRRPGRLFLDAQRHCSFLVTDLVPRLVTAIDAPSTWGDEILQGLGYL